MSLKGTCNHCNDCTRKLKQPKCSKRGLQQSLWFLKGIGKRPHPIRQPWYYTGGPIFTVASPNWRSRLPVGTNEGNNNFTDPHQWHLRDKVTWIDGHTVMVTATICSMGRKDSRGWSYGTKNTSWRKMGWIGRLKKETGTTIIALKGSWDNHNGSWF